MAEGDYCIVNSIYETTLKPLAIMRNFKPIAMDPEAKKITSRNATEGGGLNTILKSTYKTKNEYTYLKNLVQNYMRKKDGQVMEGIWNFSNQIVHIVA